jgi:hypothetical protein
MTVIATAKRRRRQAANGMNHLAKLGRPIYSKKSAEKSSERLQRMIAEERARQIRKGQSAKKK